MPSIGRLTFLLAWLAGSASFAQGHHDVIAFDRPLGGHRPTLFAKSESRMTIDDPASRVENPLAKTNKPAQQTFDKDEPIPFVVPTANGEGRNAIKTLSTGRAVGTVTSSLAIVLGVFFLIVWLGRKGLPKAATGLPREVVEVLGKTHLNGRQQMQLVRVGNKIVLLAVTATGAEALTEVTDPDEVTRLAGLCEANRSGSISATFRDVLNQFGNDSPARQSLRPRRRGTEDDYV